MQTIYYFFTAIWALIDIKSFIEFTGPKIDIWLVKSVAALLIAVSLCFIANLFIKSNRLPVIILAMACCVALASVDFYYAGKQIISPVYYLDGITQVIFLIAWIVILSRIRKQNEHL